MDIARQLASPQLVLPYLYMAAGAPVFFAGLLLPLVQFSKLISQVAFAPLLDARASRKWYMLLCFITAATALTLIGLTVLYSTALWLVVIFLMAGAMLGLGQGFNTLLHQDLLGRTILPPSRSSLLYTQTAIGGLLAVVVTWGSLHLLKEGDPLRTHLDLLWIGVIVTIIAGMAVTMIREPASQSERPKAKTEFEGEDSKAGYWGELRQGFRLVARVPWFRRFLIARGLMLSVELAMPFYAIHAATIHKHTTGSLNTFVIASSLGLIIGGPFWRWMSHRSLRAVMIIGSAIAACGGVLALSIGLLASGHTPLMYSGVFLLVALASQGTKNARKIYLVDLAPEAERPYFIAVANGVTGGLGVLVAFVFGSLAHLQHVVWPLFLIVALNLSACAYATRLRSDV